MYVCDDCLTEWKYAAAAAACCSVLNDPSDLDN